MTLAWQAVSYHALPRAGGLLDQPAGLLRKMTKVYNVWLAHQSYRRMDPGKREEWTRDNPDLHDLVLSVRRLRATLGVPPHACP